MDSLVVYESMFGNTEKIARAVARGLELEGLSVDVVEVGEAPAELPEHIGLLVVGAPTHAFSLSRPSTRADAVRQGAPAARAGIGLREWLGALPSIGAAPLTAVFDTRVTKVRWLPKAAGPRAARLARHLGLQLLTRPASFTVDDLSGPLTEGELERAVGWGRSIATAYADHGGALQPRPRDQGPGQSGPAAVGPLAG